MSGAIEGKNEMIVIEWDAVLIDNPEMTDGRSYYVEVGAGYHAMTTLWVGQHSLIFHKTMPVSTCMILLAINLV